MKSEWAVAFMSQEFRKKIQVRVDGAERHRWIRSKGCIGREEN